MKKIIMSIIALMLLMGLSSAAYMDIAKMFQGIQMIPLGVGGMGGPWIGDNAKIYFGNDKDGYIGYSTSTNYVTLSGVAATSLTDGGIVGAGNHLTCAAGNTNVDFHLGTGTFDTTTGINTVRGAEVFAADKGVTVATGTSAFDFSGGSGIFKTSGGAVTIGPGSVAFSGSPTVATGKTLAVVDADKLIVGEVIVPQYWDFNVPVSATSTDTNIFIATNNWQVVAVSEVHAVAGDNGGAVTAVIRKTNSTGAPSAGVVVTAGTFDLKGTANTIQSGVVRSGADAWVTKVNSTERLTLDVTGTLTTLAGGVVTVRLKRV